MKKIFLLLLCTTCGISQELPRIVPLSPNAASIAKYGEIPISHFTGVPNISIPIYNITSGELNLPLSLSYHAGGNKVESIASWVGLGWSLGSIPSISRSVRGIPDDAGGGYFHDYSGYTIQEIAELDPGNPIVENLRTDLFAGTADSEPDMFYYNLPSESGKFFYHQESATFNTYPKSNVRILQDGYNFRIITQEGVEYILDTVETNEVNNDAPVRSTWYTSKMISPSKRDTIYFNYRDENQTIKTRNVVTKYHFLGGISAGVPDDNGSILSINVTRAKIIESIVFKNGQVIFNANGQEREDLQGGYALEDITIYNNQKVITKYEFIGSYLTGSGNGGIGTPCYGVDSYSQKWMFLDTIRQVSSGTDQILEHTFDYDLAYSPSCRNSAAQDYWGFYNGEDFNQDLTPTYYIPNTDPPQQITAADRGVDPNKSKFGILTKIVYPTGGYTEFDFENNRAYADDVQVQYDEEDIMLSGDELIDPGETIPEINSYEKTFTINNPPDAFLNNNNPEGGSNVRFIVELPGCDISQNANPCAQFTIKGITNSVPTTDIYDSNYDPPYDRSFYLPNGTYRMLASFDQSPPQYRDFIFIAEWDVIEAAQTENKYVGGLRIKEIRSFPNSVTQPITRKYKYTTAYNSTRSSGDIFSDPNFSHQEEVVYYSNQPSGGENETYLLRVRSTSNMQQITHSGSHVGYEKVFEETSDVDVTGYTEYSFSHARDITNNNFPYPPSISKEVYRGKPLGQKFYKKTDDNFEIVKSKSFEYTDTPFKFSGDVKYSFGLKWGNNIIRRYPAISPKAQIFSYYSIDVGWYNLKRELDTIYHGNGFVKEEIDYYYDNSDHLLVTRTDRKNSRDELLISTTKYPQDIVSPSSAVTELILQNRLGEVMETKSYYDYNHDGIADSNELQTAQANEFLVWSPNLVLPETILISKGDNGLEPRIVYYGYDDDGNPIELSKSNGPHIYYVWGYNGQYPIAKIENFEDDDITWGIQGYMDAAVVASEGDNDTCLISESCNENILRDALSDLREALPSKAIMTSYTYDPLIGSTSVTDAKGYTTYYEYDAFNRLEYIRDNQENIVQDYEYHYKAQNPN